MLLPQAVQASGELKTDSIKAIKDQLLQLLQSERGDTIIRQAVSEVVSKRQYDVLVPEDTLTTDEMIAALATGATLQADYSNRLLYTEISNDIVVYANGQRLDDLHATSIALLVRLSNGEHLTLDDMEGIDPDEVMEWLENGWIWLNYPE